MTTIDIDMGALTREFVTEGLDILDRIEEATLQLEARPGDAELIRSILRGAHTLKGNASCLSLDEMSHVAHSFEDVVQTLRDQPVTADSQLITLLLRLVDEFREWLPNAVEQGNQPRPAAIALCDALRAWTSVIPSVSEESGEKGGATNTRTSAVHDLRVDIERLDRMADLSGELAIARGRLGRLAENTQSAELIESFAETERLATQLQELITRVRMVPVGTIFRPFVRTVRDLAASQGKSARLVMRGSEVEVDLSVIEHLRDPLMHMIRNSVDHGIELPDERRAKGKPGEGKITLTARHEGGSIVIEVQDDGRGLDRAAITAKARQLGVGGDVDKLSDRDVYRLILEPGFSTSEAITELSGRGVGLDVVRRNVEALRGSVDIDDRDGALFTLRLPLTLAIINGFAVAACGETYIVPVDSVVECLDLREVRHTGDGAEGIIDLRGEPLPYVALATILGLASTARARHIVVVQSHTGRVGLGVEELHGQQQTVIKPLGKIFERVRQFSGSSILSDGRVALLLDIPALVQRATRR